MLPLINIAPPPVPVQPSLVSTAIPENNTVRVPHDNVAPPVSSVGVDPNARGNNQVIAQASPTPSAPTDTNTAATAGTTTNLSPSQPLGAPATLLAQFMSQRNLPPEVQNVLRGVLGEYEKLVVNSFVKYKPSNATLPKSEPSNLFTQIINQNTATAKQAATPIITTPATQPATRTTSAASRNSDSDADRRNELEFIDGSPEPTPSASVPVTRVIQAYQVSASRIQTPVESIEETNAAG